jgi:alanyl-tRNA synthetase
MTSSAEIRKLFLDYFSSHSHEIVASSSLIPSNDNTLLFTNAGMVQFKDVFTDRDNRPYKRATTAQRCVRAGGKHNDLENVGYTTRHHTFFEMLGNFSFGDYFKREAIHFAWKFLVNVLNLPPDRLWITVYETDDESYKIWAKEVQIPRERIARIGDKPCGKLYESDNFWAMGDTGPCGPCSEIFYDHGPEFIGHPPGTYKADGDRYVEIWNLVFMQFERNADGSLKLLPKPSVDTGMGLERLTAIIQGVHSNYETDLFKNLIRVAAEATSTQDLQSSSLRVISDHIRATAFLITDGVLPSNEGRGYVLRRIMRRAIRHGYKLGANSSFFYKLVAPFAVEMGTAYPELIIAQDHVTRVILEEEERFAATLNNGMQLLGDRIGQLSGLTIPGEIIFKLYDTYGFPVDLIADVARERGLQVDYVGFERAMGVQRQRSRAHSHFISSGIVRKINWDCILSTNFDGYDRIEEDATVIALFCNNQPVDEISSGEEGIVVLDRTPFYAESGGQVGDTGWMRASSLEFEVCDTQKQDGRVFSHIGILKIGHLQRGDQILAQVDIAKRQATTLHHSSTHLLHAALRLILGSHVTQKGSLVDSQRLRFDFSHCEPINNDQFEAIERLVNTQIRGNASVEVTIMAPEQAVATGALALFSEKYGDMVRVLRMGEFSIEICGGTHVHRVGEIGLFKIISEVGVAAGVRRIEAVAGARALDYIASLQNRERQVARLVKGGSNNLLDKISQLVNRVKNLESEVEQLKCRLKASNRDPANLLSRVIDIDGIKVLVARLEGADVKALREAVDNYKEQLNTAVVVLAAVENNKVRITAGVTLMETQRIRAFDLVNFVARQVGGKGGGRPDLAHAGGTDPTKLDESLRSIPEWIHKQLTCVQRDHTN